MFRYAAAHAGEAAHGLHRTVVVISIRRCATSVAHVHVAHITLLRLVLATVARGRGRRLINNTHRLIVHFFARERQLRRTYRRQRGRCAQEQNKKRDEFWVFTHA